MPKFKLYSCKLRLEGSVLNEVPKEDLTAAEIDMFRALHGSDAVASIVETGERSASAAAERARVQEIFMNPLDAPVRLKAKTEMFRNLFGHDSLPLPTALASDVDDEDNGDETGGVTAVPEKPAIRRTRAVKPEPEASFAE